MEKSRVFTEVEIKQLFWLCSDAEDEVDSWNSVRDWLKNNRNNAKLIAAAVNNHEEGETPLHLILRKCPPLDIVHEMIEIAPNLLRLPNSHGLLPLHIACQHSSTSVEVIDKLILGAPITVHIGDSFAWLPIHFACANPDASVDIVNRLLRDANDTVRFKNNNAQLPIHLACVSGASFEVISRLLKDAPETVQDEDYLSRTPILLAGSYGAQEEIINRLQQVATEIRSKEIFEAENASKEIESILTDCKSKQNEEKWKLIQDWINKYRTNANIVVPEALFEMIWDLPKILRDAAVKDVFIQNNLNRLFSKRESVIYLMMDIYCSFLMVLLFYWGSIFRIRKFATDHADKRLPAISIIFLLCGTYKGFRGISRLMHLIMRGSILSLAMSPIVHLHHAIISAIIFTRLAYYWHWNTDPSLVTNSQTELFRCLSAILCGILGLDLWIAFTYASLMFARTSNGVGHVLKRISCFLFVLLFVILTFSLMFSTVYSSTNICEEPEDFIFCKFGTSMIELYGNLFGNVEYSYFYVSASGVLLDPRLEGNFAVVL